MNFQRTDAVTCMYETKEMVSFLYFYLSATLSLFYFLFLFSEPIHMQKYLVHLKPKDCYFLGIKQKKNQVFLYSRVL